MNPLSILKSVIISLLLFNLAWAITACKKNNSNSIKSYMRYKVDGEQKQYDTCYVTLMGQFPNSTPPFYYCAIACGRYGNSGIIATLYNNNEISATQYPEAIFSRPQLPTAILEVTGMPTMHFIFPGKTGGPIILLRLILLKLLPGM